MKKNSTFSDSGNMEENVQFMRINVSQTKQLVISVKYPKVIEIYIEDVYHKSILIQENDLLKQFIEDKMRMKIHINQIRKMVLQNEKVLLNSNKNRLFGGGNQQTIPKQKQDVKNVSEPNQIVNPDKQENIDEEQQENQDESLPLSERYNSIMRKKISYISTRSFNTEYERISQLKGQLLKFIEDNQEKILENFLESRYLLYRFFSDYKDFYFLTFQKRFDNSQELFQRFKLLSAVLSQGDNYKKPYLDIEYQINLLGALEKFKTTKGYESKLETTIQDVHRVHESLYLNYLAFEEDKKSCGLGIRSQIKQQKEQIQSYVIEIIKDGEEVVSSIQSKFDVILDQINLDANEKDFGILQLLSLNQNTSYQSYFTESLFKIMKFLEYQLLLPKEEITICANHKILQIFLKNVFKLSSEQDLSKPGEEYKRYMLYTTTLHLKTLLERKEQQNTCTYEDLILYLYYQESFPINNIIQCTSSLKVDNNFQLEIYQQLIKQKFNPSNFQDIVDYVQNIKYINSLISFNIPEINEQSLFSQSLNYLGGDNLPQPLLDDQLKPSNIYQQVISYFKKEDSSLKFMIVNATFDSGKTIFLKKLMQQIDEYNKQKDINPIYHFYLRSKYFNIKEGSLDNILLQEPFNFTFAQMNKFYEPGIKLIIIDGFNETQKNKKQLKHFFKTIKAKNIHFLITTREENMKQDIFYNLSNYILLELQTTYIKKIEKASKKEKDFEIFSKEEQKLFKGLKIETQQINLFVNKPLNIFMISEIKSMYYAYNTNKGKIVKLLSSVQSQTDLIVLFIDISLSFAISSNYTNKTVEEEKQNLKGNKNKSVSTENPKKAPGLTISSKQEEELKDECKKYLETLAYLTFIKEYERCDEDFSISEDDLQEYLPHSVKKVFSQVNKIIQDSYLTLTFSDGVRLFYQEQKLSKCFKLTSVFVYFLTSALASDFQKSLLDVDEEQIETLCTYQIAQRPIVKKPAQRLQIEILDSLFYKLFQIQNNLENKENEDEQQENEENQENKQNEDNNDKQQKELDRIYNKLPEGIIQLNKNYVKFMKKSTQDPDEKFKIGASNIMSAIFQSNLCLYNQDFSGIQFPYSYINEQYQVGTQFSDQQQNNQIQYFKGKLVIEGVVAEQSKQKYFDEIQNIGENFQPRQLVSFNDDTIFFIAGNYVYKYIIKNNKFYFAGATNLNEARVVLNILRKSKSFLFCSLGINKVYRIQPETMQYIPLTIENEEYANLSINVFAITECGQYLASSFSDGRLFIWEINVKQQKLIKKYLFSMGVTMHFLKFISDVTRLIILTDSRIFVFSPTQNEDKNQESQYTFLLSNYIGNKSQWADIYGDYIAIGNNDGRLRIIQISDNYKFIEQLSLHNDWIRCVQFSSCGRYILTSSDDYSAGLYDMEKKTTQYIRGKMSNYVMFGVFVNQDKIVATSLNGEDIVQLWDTSSLIVKNQSGNQEDGGQSEQKNKDLYIGSIRSEDFSSNYLSMTNDCQYLANASPNYTVQIWNLTKNKNDKSIQPSIQKILEGHTLEVLCVAYSPDNKLLASCSNDRTILIWNVEQDYQLANKGSNMEHDEAVNCVAFSPISPDLASGGWDEMIKIWKIIKVDQSYFFQLSNELNHQKAVLCVAYSPSGEILASGSADNTISIWRTKDYEQYYSIKSENWIYSINFTSDNKQLVTGSKNNRLTVYEVYKSFNKKFEYVSNNSIYTVISLRKGQFIFTGDQQGRIDLHQAISQNNYKSQLVSSLQLPATSIIASQNQKLIVAGAKKSMKIFRMSYFKDEVIKLRHESEITFIGFTSNGILVTIDQHGNLKMWDSKLHFKHVASLELNHTESHLPQAYQAALTFNNEYFATFTDYECKIWDKNLRLVNTLNYDNNGSKIIFSPNGTFLVKYKSDLIQIQIYKAADEFKEPIDIDVDKTNLRLNQYKSLFQSFNIKRPFLFNLQVYYYADCGSDIDIEKIKSITFSPDEKFMFVRMSAENFVWYQVDLVNNKFILFNTSEIDENIVGNLNYEIFYKNESYANRLDQQDYHSYYQTLVRIPYNIYQNNGYIESKYRFISSISYDSKYYAAGLNPSCIGVWCIYNYLREYFEESIIEIEDEIEVEEVGAQNQQENKEQSEQNNLDGEQKLEKQGSIMTVQAKLVQNQGDVLIVDSEEQNVTLKTVENHNEEGKLIQNQQDGENQKANNEEQNQEGGEDQNQNKIEDQQQNQQEEEKDLQNQQSPQAEEKQEEIKKEKRTKKVYKRRFDIKDLTAKQDPSYIL